MVTAGSNLAFLLFSYFMRDVFVGLFPGCSVLRALILRQSALHFR
jgi:hypothetical protein